MGGVHVNFPVVILHCGLVNKMLPLGETLCRAQVGVNLQ